MLLALGRASNLPTVWSNVLAAWLIGGGAWGAGAFPPLAWLLLGGSLLYLGGTTLNDAFDAEFDRKFRPERPIPSGRISASAVWALGIGYLLVGAVCWAIPGGAGWALTAALVAAILLYDWIHKKNAAAGVPLMGACRLLLYAGSAAAALAGNAGGFTAPPAIWGIALAVYVCGLTIAARKESTAAGEPDAIGRWPLILLFAPAALWAAHFAKADAPIYTAVFPALFLAWVMRGSWTLRDVPRGPGRIGAAVAQFLAGIALFDAMAASLYNPGAAWFLLIAFPLALLAQRSIPAT